MRAHPGISRERKNVLGAGALIAGAAWIAYRGSFLTPFVFDDGAVIADNATIRHLWPLSGVLSPPAGGQTVSGRPILNLSYALNYAFSGTSVFSYHAVNVAIHIACGWLLFGLAKAAFERRGDFPSVPLAFAVALLWTVHPLQTESVTYLAQRAESLAAFFSLLSIYAFTRGAATGNARSWLALSVAACALGLATKESVAATPLLIFAFDSIFIAGGWRDALRKRWAWYIALALTWTVPFCLSAATLGRGGTAGFGSGISSWAYALTQCRAIARYLALSIWPRPLVFDYGTGLAHSFAAIAPGAVMITFIAIATVRALRRRSPGGFLGLWFFALLAPSSSVIPIATQTEAEHRMYLPLAAVIAFIVAAGYSALRRSRAPDATFPSEEAGSLRPSQGSSTVGMFLALCGAAAAALAVATIARNGDYRSAITLWQDTVSKRPANPRAHCNLGAALLAAGRYDEAILEERWALQLQPDYALAELNWGNALLRQDKLPQALEHYEAAVKRDPGSADAHSNDGTVLLKLRRFDDAAAEFRASVEIAPLPDSYANLATALARSGKLEESLPAYRRALQGEPRDADTHYNFGNALARLGRSKEAQAEYEEALKLNPDLSDARSNLDQVRRQKGDTPTVKTGLPKAILMGACALTCGAAWAHPNFASSIQRPLRYTPDGGDFVIVNGSERFNRPLYGCNSAFRVDAGDKPEFSLYLPGRGGNLRLGIQSEGTGKWLTEADRIVARYHPGEMIYEITDKVLGAARLRLSVLPTTQAQGVVLELRLEGTSDPLTLIAAYGGANGQRGKRDGDIGCEDVPVSQFFQLKPEYCRDDRFELTAEGFLLHNKGIILAGVASPSIAWHVADARSWNDPRELVLGAEQSADTPVVVGRMDLRGANPVYFAIERLGTTGEASADLGIYQEVAKNPKGGEFPKGPPTWPKPSPSRDLPDIFRLALLHRDAVATRVAADTPDPFLNAATSALCVAADAVWDESQGVYMHGAVAWRTKLLGWRGPYSADALGWHDRAERHLTYWATRQNTNKVPEQLTPADSSANLSRNEASLHTNGDLSNSHYDMNLVYIDALVRHLLWTGDLSFARKLWPVIVRHIAWEKRLFRRPFGKDHLPLYEGYCCIWASDDVAYDGGGATHATAYNYYHNRMAARLARLLGEEPAPYDQEAELIARAMKTYLWLPELGRYAESKDLLGLQRVHPEPALWTFYHAVDSETATPMQGWEMSRYVDTEIAHIPVIGPGVPVGDYYTLPTSNWMPYQWSTNNVVLAEAAHTALALWEAGRSDDAFRLFKGCLLDSMYLGLCPGNAGMCTGYDMARGETQRDFADASGVCSRALVEGLFGVHPDALAGEVVLQPGFPEEWNHARLQHADFDLNYSKRGATERIQFKSKWDRPMAIRLRIRAKMDRIEKITNNGDAATWTQITTAIGNPLIEIRGAASKNYDIAVTWAGRDLTQPTASETFARGSKFEARFGTAELVEVADPQSALQGLVQESHLMTATASGLPGGRTVFARLTQGDFTWWAPIEFEIRTQFIPDRSMSASGHFEPVDLRASFNDKVTEIFRHDYSAPRSPYCSLALPLQGIGSWCHPLATYEVDDSGLRQASDRGHGVIVMPNGVPFETPGKEGGDNILFTSQWTQFPSEATIPLTGHAEHAYLLMAGSTNAMQSRFENGEIVVTYADGSSDRLALTNPETWWPIDQDYLTDDYAFRRTGVVPMRIDLRTGVVRSLSPAQLLGRSGQVRGGAATVLDLALDPKKTLQALTLRTRANEVVIGLMSLTLGREGPNRGAASPFPRG